jgi:O-antigen ligase
MLPALVVVVAALLAGGYPTRIAALLCAAVWLALLLAALWRSPPIPSAAALALAGLAALSALSADWGRSGEAFGAAVLPALYAGLLYAADWIGPATLDPLRGATVAVAALGIAGRATGLAAPSPEPGSVRMAWPIGYANGLGLLCALGVVLCIGRRRWWPGAAVCAVALVWTFSRSAIVACVAGLVLLAVLRGLVSKRWALAGAIVLAVAAVLLARPVYQRFQSPAPDTRDAARLATVSGHGRTTLWRSALTIGAHHPLAGAGAGAWRRVAGKDRFPANPHSLELQVFAELGVLGLALLAAFLVGVLRRRAPPEALAAFVAWALVAASDWDWQLPAVTGAAAIAAGAARPR